MPERDVSRTAWPADALTTPAAAGQGMRGPRPDLGIWACLPCGSCFPIRAPILPRRRELPRGSWRPAGHWVMTEQTRPVNHLLGVGPRWSSVGRGRGRAGDPGDPGHQGSSRECAWVCRSRAAKRSGTAPLGTRGTEGRTLPLGRPRMSSCLNPCHLGWLGEGKGHGFLWGLLPTLSLPIHGAGGGNPVGAGVRVGRVRWAEVACSR